MDIYKKFKIDLYEITGHIIISDDLTRHNNWINKKHNLEDSDGPTETTEGMCCVLSKDFYVLLREQDLSINTVTHELYHVTKRVAERRGIFDEEAQAWICGYLNQKTFEILLQHNLLQLDGKRK